MRHLERSMKPLVHLALAASIGLTAGAQTASLHTAAQASAAKASVAHQMKAINYRNSSTSKVDMQGTQLMPSAGGEAQVKSKNGRVEVELRMAGLEPANKFGMEYLTYVLWAISPQGRAVNLGELVLDHGQTAV